MWSRDVLSKSKIERVGQESIILSGNAFFHFCLYRNIDIVLNINKKEPILSSLFFRSSGFIGHPWSRYREIRDIRYHHNYIIMLLFGFDILACDEEIAVTSFNDATTTCQ
jgi:hypothetical protein